MISLLPKPLTAVLLALSCCYAKAATYHVATNGSDIYPGTIGQPFKTIQHAASLARSGDTVLIRGGTYRETIVPASSGTAVGPIIFAAYGEEQAVVSGANLLASGSWSGFSNATYQATTFCGLGEGNQVFVDGQMMNEARFPNTSLDVTRPIKLIAEGGSCVGEWAKAIGTITNAALVQPAGYWVGATMNIALGKVWVAETVRVMASGPGWLSFSFPKGDDYLPLKGNPFFLTGKFSELDAAGEWFYDAARNRVFLWTPTGDSPAQHTVETKARQLAFDLRGKSYIVVRGLRLFAATIVTDERSSHNLLDGLTARYVSHFSTMVRWRTGLTDSGIILAGQSNTLQNCVISFSSGNGVALLGSGNIVSNNVIHDIDYSGGVGAGINTGGGCRSAVISHNTIFDVGHRMIDMGHLRSGLIQYNDLSHGGIQMSDFGGIYAASTDGENTRICYNRIHDTDGPSNGLKHGNNSKGIYIDNGSSNYVIDHNVTWNVDRSIVLNSREDTAETNRNNLILNNTLSGTAWSYGWKHCPSPETLIANNIFLARAEPGVGATVSNNLFRVTDPRFAPGSRFELQADSPARNAGLVRAPYSVAPGGGSPDIGAFPFGKAPWTAGSSLEKSQKPLTSKTDATTRSAAAAMPAAEATTGVQASTLVSSAIPIPLVELQRDLVNLRFGMFIHLSPATYLDATNQLQSDHAPPRQGKDWIHGTADDLSPALLNPVKLDCGQWADAAKSAGMKFAVLTTKHHDGFCLWPSQYSTYTVAQGCQRDIVREFTEAFRKQGIRVGLYYSIRDRTERISGDARQGGVSPKKTQLIKNQLTELLTNYGEILYIVFDAWGNTWHESPSYSDIPYAEIYDHIKSLQPNCLVLNHTRIRSVSDVPHIELNAHMGLPTGADWPAVGGDTLQSTWFWRTNYPTSTLRSVDWIVKDNLIPDNQRNVVFQLNCAPNRDGLFDENVLARLAEVGKAWGPPPPLAAIPDSWKNWPVPASIHLFTGKNIARDKPVRFSSEQKIKTAEGLVDGNPKSAVDLGGTNAWLEIDLGQSQPLAGIQIWNRAAAKNVILEHGFIFVSAEPFQSDEPAEIQRQSGVTCIAVTEPPGYPTPYPIGKTGRYVRIVSDTGRPIGIGEVEIFSKTE